MDFDRPGLIALVKSEFKLDWQGIHGANHWARVLNHGKNIGQIRKADLLVVELFGFLHDSCRLNDDKDPQHGERAADFAHGIHGDYFNLQPLQLDYLCYALRHHSGGEVSTNRTIQTCWDADRLKKLQRKGWRILRRLHSPTCRLWCKFLQLWSRSRFEDRSCGLLPLGPIMRMYRQKIWPSHVH